MVASHIKRNGAKHSPIALYSGRPVILSHTTIVSRWFVMPTAAISPLPYPVTLLWALIFANDSSMHFRTISKISMGSCSIHRSFGWICWKAISCSHNSSNCGFDLNIWNWNSLKFVFEHGHATKQISFATTYHNTYPFRSSIDDRNQFTFVMHFGAFLIANENNNWNQMK